MTYSAARIAGWRWFAASAAASLLTLALVVGLGARPAAGNHSFTSFAAPSAHGKLTPALARLADRSPDRSVEVIVQMRARAGLGPAKGSRLVEQAGGRVTQTVPIIRGLAAEMTASQARFLASDPAVHAVTLNGKVEPNAIDVSRLKSAYDFSVKAQGAWNNKDATGKGVGVAVIDSGINGDNPDFRTSDTDHGSRVKVSAVVNPGTTSARDTIGHGTHVAGLIAGNGWNRDSTDPNEGRYIGTAPDADLINVKASADDGSITDLDVINGLQFVFDHKDDYNIRVANLSLGSTVAQSYRIDPLDAAVEAVWARGVVVVAAAGNAGNAADAVHYAPGNDPYVITVGAADDKGTTSTTDDTIPSWSSRGLTQDGFVKPDMVAPGSQVPAPLAKGSEYEANCPACVVDGEYIRLGGTSMATAVAAGAAATVIEENPGYSPDQVKGVLMNTARDIAGGAADEVAQNQATGTTLVPLSNVGLVPNDDIAAMGGLLDLTRISWRNIDWSRISWRRISWRTAEGDLSAGFSRISWRADLTPVTTDANGNPVDPNRISWRRISWRTSFEK
jgi:serine protease AprX